ncbi:Biotin transport ATP-binding protein BioM [Corynebacterium kalinowskii]|uniref:Biotin transport ATP-binding protein BioM n=1 Tax=Corynebacterium kalinowskii TaxID=2675216 RepID=A0A6B8VY37_9CORY|nr:ABC transporter ATP-binding protein [Corynebacterium kalinowskii]QGU02230.1 Biotin transport ATP-binding protein BioM [Corynebacterium kalinowskii]
MISFRDVSVSYDQRDVLHDITLELTESRIGIIGANGGGKSTLIRLINGLGSPTSGTVLVDGLDVSTDGRAVRRNVGFVFSDAENQIVMPTVAEDVEFSLRRLKLPKAERSARVDQMLERFDLAGHRDDSPHTLSGGQKQLLALAAVLIMEPSIVIADEPTTLLDLKNRMKIKAEFAKLPQQLIVVTHDLDFVADFDRVLCLDGGTIVADGQPHEVIATYEQLMAE